MLCLLVSRQSDIPREPNFRTRKNNHEAQQTLDHGSARGYALFNYEAASDQFTADPSPSDCGHACHVAVKAKDHIFHPYQKR
jgi:hypothetical protein